MLTLHIVIYLVVGSPNLRSQEQNTTIGREFYVSFLPNFHNNIRNPVRNIRDSLYIFCAGPPSTSVMIHYRNREGFTNSTELIIPQNGMAKFGVPWIDYEPFGFNNSGLNFTLGDNGRKIRPYFRVVSGEDISVYALNQAITTSDASIVYPVTSLGTDYYILSYPSDGIVDDDTLVYHSTPSQTIVTATEDNTKITITTKSDLVNQFDFTGNYARSIEVVLNKGESYLLQTLIELKRLQNDISGTRIESSKPIAVFAGHQRSPAPRDAKETGLSRDHLFEQVPPTNQWGYSFQLIPFPSGIIRFTTYNVFRIIASEDSTIVFANGLVLDTLMKGELLQGSFYNPLRITSNKPVLVAIIKASSQSDRYSVGTGDPLLLYVPPHDQYLKSYVVSNIQAIGTNARPDDITYTEQYISIVTHKSGLQTLRLDGAPIDSVWIKPIPKIDENDICDYVYAIIPVFEGAHTLRSSIPFATYVFGYGNANSYGYVGGLGTKNIIRPSVYKASNDTVICKGQQVVLSLSGGKKYKWLTSPYIKCDTCSENTVLPDSSTKFYIEVTDDRDCIFIDSIFVRVSSLSLSLPNDTTICLGTSIVISTVGGDMYHWKTDTTLSCFDCPSPLATPNKPIQTYYVTTTNKDGCSLTDSITIKTNPLIVTTLKDSIICRGDSLILSAEGASMYRWTPQRGLFCDTCKTTIAKPSTTTTYIVTGYTDSQCKGSDTITITVNTLSIKTNNDTIICLGSSVLAIANGSSGKYSWSPRQGVSCDTCRITEINPQKTTMYYVEVSDEYCSGIDSMLITVSELESTLSPDTIICTGDKVQLQSTEAKTYLWSPSTSLSCNTCQSPVAFPSQTTKYICRTESEFSCTDIDTVTVYVRLCRPYDTLYCTSSLVCDTSISVYTIYNTKEIPAKRTFSILSYVGDEGVFTLQETSIKNFDMSFGDSLQIRVLFSPKQNKFYSGYFTCRYDDGEEFILYVSGYGRASNVLLATNDSFDIIPGSFIDIRVYASSKDWEFIDLHSLRITLKYLHRSLMVSDISLNNGIIQNWTFNYKEHIETDYSILTIDAQGADNLRDEGLLCTVRFRTLLFDNPVIKTNIVGSSPLYPCIDFSETISNVELTSCFMQGRMLKTSSIPYTLETSVNERNISFDIGIGLSGMTLLELFTMTGEKIQTIVNSPLQQGQYQYTINRESISSGVYYIALYSGVYRIIVPFLIEK